MIIWFDMDGTLFDLYGVPNWLASLQNYDATPYARAGVMHNMSKLARYLNKVQAAGCELGIISWLSRGSTAAYDEAVTRAKLASLRKHLPSVHWNHINIVSYGTPKINYKITNQDILFDDEVKNRRDWNGSAYMPHEIFTVLKRLL